MRRHLMLAATLAIAGIATVTGTVNQSPSRQTARWPPDPPPFVISPLGLGQRGSGETTTTRTTECFGHEEECGYPGLNNTGVEKGVTLTASGQVKAKTEGQVVKNLRITNGGIDVEAKNVRIENVEIVTANLQKSFCEEKKVSVGTGTIRIGTGGLSPDFAGTVINHVTVKPPSAECPELGNGDVEIAMPTASPSETVIRNSQFVNGPICWKGEMTIENSYCENNAVAPGFHYDGLYLGAGSVILTHNTLRMPHNGESTIAVFTDAGNIEELRVENNLIAGGGHLADLGDKFPGTPGKEVLGPVYFRNNRIARCVATPFVKGPSGNNPSGGEYCTGHGVEEPGGSDGIVTPDTHGYWPNGGYYGGLNIVKPEVTTITGNVWDNNGATFP